MAPLRQAVCNFQGGGMIFSCLGFAWTEAESCQKIQCTRERQDENRLTIWFPFFCMLTNVLLLGLLLQHRSIRQTPDSFAYCMWPTEDIEEELICPNCLPPLHPCWSFGEFHSCTAFHIVLCPSSTFCWIVLGRARCPDGGFIYMLG